MYRDDRVALLAQTAALRMQLADAAGDADRERELRQELAAKLAILQEQGIGAAKRESVASGVRKRGVMLGVVAAIAFLSLGIVAYPIVGAWWPMTTETKTAAQTSERSWFNSMKPRCNALEARVAVRQDPAPGTPEGQGYLATCFALAHQVDAAAAVLQSVPEQERIYAVRVLFRLVHPVADAGDDVAAGPVMELIVKHDPNNYMALFHAGMAAHETGRPVDARSYLQRFLENYQADDGWTAKAKRALGEIEALKIGLSE